MTGYIQKMIIEKAKEQEITLEFVESLYGEQKSKNPKKSVSTINKLVFSRILKKTEKNYPNTWTYVGEY